MSGVSYESRKTIRRKNGRCKSYIGEGTEYGMFGG